VVEGIDVAQPDVGETLVGALEPDVEIDVLVNNAGILRHDTFDRLDLEAAREEFEVNTLGPLRVTAALLPRLGSGAKIAFVSSKAGSIGDRPSGGMYGYRMSKAALNMAGANLAREIARRGVLVVVLHPGYVATDMTGGTGTIHPAAAATGLIARIEELDPSRSGRFLHADGSEIPW
jgi:NAD(P)-dependent dehydrogenase (short-subunit alcohol dehydrogenase family)